MSKSIVLTDSFLIVYISMQALWMLLASAMFAVMGSFVKLAAEHGASMPQIVLFRGLPSVVLILIYARAGGLSFVPAAWMPHVWRNLTGVTSMWLGFFAISKLPLATATSLSYTAPLFIAGWILARGSARRDPVCIAAVFFGFLGVIAVLRPSITVEQILPAVLGLASGALAAVAMMQIREIGRLGEPEWRTVLFFSIVASASSLVGIAMGSWSWSDWIGWASLFAIGASGLFGQLALTRAYGLGSALLNAALQYSTIIFAALIGIGFWGEQIDDLALFGGICIICAGLMSLWRTISVPSPDQTIHESAASHLPSETDKDPSR
jgi:S-adenosylmethionine uptake transporter